MIQSIFIGKTIKRFLINFVELEIGVTLIQDLFLNLLKVPGKPRITKKVSFELITFLGKEAGIDRDLEDFLDQRQEIKLLLQKLQVPEYMFDYFAIVKEPKRKKLLKHYLQYFLQNKQEEIEKQQIKEKIIEEEEEEASELINIPATIKIIGTKKNTEEEEQSKEEKKSKLESEEIKEKLSRIKEAKKSIRKPIINTLIMNQNNLIKKTEKKGKEKEKQQEKDEEEENEDIDDVEDEDLFDFGRQKHQN